MKFKIFQRDDQRDGDHGVYCTFINGRGYGCTTFFNSPPDSIDHVDISYLQGRFGNVVRREQVEFIKREFKKEIIPFYRED